MDFIKSAVASAIAQGPPFPYTFGDKVDIDESIWTLYNGTRREDGSNCSIFSFDVPANKSRLPLAKNALKNLRTLRHPGVLKILDTVETDSYIYIATERVVPLRWHVKRKSLSPETIEWGLHSIARTVKFINGDASSIHGNLKVGSVYTTESGEWKLGGFEVLSSIKDDESIIYTYGSMVPDSAGYAPPELVHGGWGTIKKNPHSAMDSFNFGTLIFEVFNGHYSGTELSGQTKNVPPTMHSSYKRLCNANPKARITVGNFLDQGNRKGSFFDSPLIKLAEGIDNLGVKSPGEREEFLRDLDELHGDFPEEFFKLKIFPELIKSVEFGGGGPQAMTVVLKIASRFSPDEFNLKAAPFLVKAFANPDRAIRVCLLDKLGLIIELLPTKVFNDKIFPHIVAGFTDLQPVVREQTLKSVLVLVTKLSERTINGELLRQLAKTANDEQPGIRTNTTICLGKLAKHLGSSSRSKVLIAAFTRSLRDPFVHARNAALMALAATADYFSEDDSACRILPALCPLLMDTEKVIQDQAMRSIETYMQKVRKAAAALPDTALPPRQGAEAQAARMSTPQSSGSSSWAGWAISSFTNKMSAAAGEMQTANGLSSVAVRPVVSPSVETYKATTASATPPHGQVMKSPLSKDASGNSCPMGSAVAGDYFADDAVDDGADDGWGEMGDMGDEDEMIDGPVAASEKVPTTMTSATPFDNGEPDFAGWLAAQAQEKASSSKTLPRGLYKAPTAKKAVLKATGKAPTSKKIDLKPKETEVDDDGWADGW